LLRGLVTGLFLPMFWFNPRPFHKGLMIEEVSVGLVFLRVLRYYPQLYLLIAHESFINLSFML